MITAVDTNVLIDIFTEDAEFAEHSAAAVREALARGVLVACEVVWAETAALFPEEAAFRNAVRTLGVVSMALTEESAMEAGRAWKRCRAAGGARSRVISDFLIGAHALRQCDGLLARDRGFYAKYFPALSVTDPSRG